MGMCHDLRSIAPGVIVLRSAYRGISGAIVRGSGGALLIDPGLFPAEQQVLGEIARRWGGLRYLVATHSHWDRLPGWAGFGEVERIAHASFFDCLQGQELARRAAGQPSIGELLRDLDHAHSVERPPLTFAPPDRTCSQSLRLDLGARTALLLHLPGHSPDSLALLLPDDGVLCVGDMLCDHGIPAVADSAAYLQSLDLVEGLVREGQAHTVVPGRGRVLHGAAEIGALVRADRSYVLGVHQPLTHALSTRRSAAQGHGKTARPDLFATS